MQKWTVDWLVSFLKVEASSDVVIVPFRYYMYWTAVVFYLQADYEPSSSHDCLKTDAALCLRETASALYQRVAYLTINLHSRDPPQSVCCLKTIKLVRIVFPKCALTMLTWANKEHWNASTAYATHLKAIVANFSLWNASLIRSVCTFYCAYERRKVVCNVKSVTHLLLFPTSSLLIRLLCVQSSRSVMLKLRSFCCLCCIVCLFISSSSNHFHVWCMQVNWKQPNQIN